MNNILIQGLFLLALIVSLYGAININDNKLLWSRVISNSLCAIAYLILLDSTAALLFFFLSFRVLFAKIYQSLFIGILFSILLTLITLTSSPEYKDLFFLLATINSTLFYFTSNGIILRSGLISSRIIFMIGAIFDNNIIFAIQNGILILLFLISSLKIKQACSTIIKK